MHLSSMAWKLYNYLPTRKNLKSQFLPTYLVGRLNLDKCFECNIIAINNSEEID